MENQYQGVKFKTEFLSSEIPKGKQLEILKDWCNIFHKKGLAPNHETGSFGNLSYRIKTDKDEFIITGSGTFFSLNMDKDCFCEVKSCDLEQNIVFCNGVIAPSSESMLHFAVYQKYPEIQAIFHGHNVAIIHSAEKLDLPVTQSEEQYGSIRLVNRVLNICSGNNFVVMRNHGFISMGKTMGQAGRNALSVLKKTNKFIS